MDADPMLGMAQWCSHRTEDEPRPLHALPNAEPVTASNIRRLGGKGGVPLPISNLAAAPGSSEKAGYAIYVSDMAPTIAAGDRT